MQLFSPPSLERSGKGGGENAESRPAIQKKRGSIGFPLDQLILYCYVSPIDPGAKIRNLSGNPRRQDPPGHCSANRGPSLHGGTGNPTQRHPSGALQLAHRPGERANAPGAAAWQPAHRPAVLKEALRLLCKEDWSPRQIAGIWPCKGKPSPMRPCTSTSGRMRAGSCGNIAATG